MAPTTLAAAITQLPQFTNSAVPEGAPSSGWTGRLRCQHSESARHRPEPHARAARRPARGGIDPQGHAGREPAAGVTREERGSRDGRRVRRVRLGRRVGVVNFILDNKFEGFKTDIQGGVTELGDNKNYTVSLAGGIPLGERMHLITAVDYYSADPITDPTRRDGSRARGSSSIR